MAITVMIRFRHAVYQEGYHPLILRKHASAFTTMETTIADDKLMDRNGYLTF